MPFRYQAAQEAVVVGVAELVDPRVQLQVKSDIRHLLFPGSQLSHQ